MTSCKKNTRQRKPVFGRQSIPPLLTLAIGIVLSFAAAITVHDWEHERVRLTFEQDVRGHIAALQRGLKVERIKVEIFSINFFAGQIV